MRTLNRASYQWTEGIVASGIVSVQLVPADAGRITLRVQAALASGVSPDDLNDNWMSLSNPAVTFNGIPVLQRTPVILTYEDFGPLVQQAWFVISAALPANISVVTVRSTYG